MAKFAVRTVKSITSGPQPQARHAHNTTAQHPNEAGKAQASKHSAQLSKLDTTLGPQRGGK